MGRGEWEEGTGRELGRSKEEERRREKGRKEKERGGRDDSFGISSLVFDYLYQPKKQLIDLFCPPF